jgi:hypothetical protein
MMSRLLVLRERSGWSWIMTLPTQRHQCSVSLMMLIYFVPLAMRQKTRHSRTVAIGDENLNSTSAGRWNKK